VTIATALARPLLAGAFVYGGLDALRNPAGKVAVGEPVLEPISEATGWDERRLVAVNGGVQVAAGVALALGILPRAAATVLAASLVPTTLASHRFWERDDAAAKQADTLHFLQSLAMLGGLVFAATSTGGRPSVPWLTKRAAHRLAESTGDVVGHLRPG